MKICIILPSERSTPAGGYKVMYEYANLLVKNNHNVYICYPFNIQIDLKKTSTLFKIRSYRWFLKMKDQIFATPKWFNLDTRVKEKRIFHISKNCLPKSDVYIATAVNTAMCLNKVKDIQDKKKYYFIQGYETWIVDEKTLVDTYHYPINKIVISKWLQDILTSYGESSTLIHNGFNFEEFKYSKPIEERDKFTISMLYHSSEGKGCTDGIIALYLAKQKYPQIRAKLFGVPNKPSFLPDWIDYYQTPNNKTHNDIYNSSSIFIGTSYSEGWGLTVGEAMICGCAVVCTNIGGYLEMAKDSENALVVPTKSPEIIAASICRLIENDELRFSLSKQGRNSIKMFSIEKSYGDLIKILKDT